MRFLSPYHEEIILGFVIVGISLYFLTIFNKRVYFKASDEIIAEGTRLTYLGANLVLFLVIVVLLKILLEDYINSFVRFLILSLISLYFSYWLVEIYVRIITPKYKRKNKDL